MTDWSAILKKFGIDNIIEPDCWQLLGISSSHSDRTLIDAALASRRRMLASLEMSADKVVLQNFETDVLLPAYFFACESLNNVERLPAPHPDNRLGTQEELEVVDCKADDDTDEILLKELPVEEERIVSRWLEDDPEDNGQEYSLAGDGDINIKQQESSYDQSEPVAQVKPGRTDIPDEPIALEELLADDSVVPMTKESDQSIPLLIPAEEPVGQEEIPVLESVDSSDEAEDDPVESENEDVPDEDEVIISEPDVSGGGYSKIRLLLWCLATVPFLALMIFVLVLFNATEKPEEEGSEPQRQDYSNVLVGSEKFKLAIKKQVVDSGFEPQDIPDHFLIVLEKLAGAYSNGDDSLALLEDIGVTIQAWQMVAGNISDTSALCNIIDGQLFRNNKRAFDLDEYNWQRIAEMLGAKDNQIEISPDYFAVEMQSGDKPRIRRIIELAGVSGSEPLRDKLLGGLTVKEAEIPSRVIRTLCSWYKASDQYEMLGAIVPARRDLSRRIIDNLNMRYSNIPVNNMDVGRYLPNEFGRREIENTQRWWQANIMTLEQHVNVMPGGIAVSDDTTAEVRRVGLLTGILKNAYVLSAVLRSSVDLPVLPPDLEINGRRELLADQLLSDSLSQIRASLLAVIYDIMAQDDVLPDIDLIRLGSLEYDFIDTNLHAQARANEILIYCKIMNGEKYESEKVSRYNQKSNTLLLVRDALYESLKHYASSRIVRYDRPAKGFDALALEISTDYSLAGGYSFNDGASQAGELADVLARLHEDPFSRELYEKARTLSTVNNNVDSGGLVYLQLGIKALTNRKFGSGVAIAIDCFQRAMEFPLGREIIEQNLPALAQVFQEHPGYFCPDCGNSGYTICPACEGFLFVRCETCQGDGEIVQRSGAGHAVCPDCGGIGKHICENCTGSGVIRCQKCDDYISEADLFLPDVKGLESLSQAINLASLKISLEVSQITQD